MSFFWQRSRSGFWVAVIALFVGDPVTKTEQAIRALEMFSVQCREAVDVATFARFAPEYIARLKGEADAASTAEKLVKIWLE